MKLFENLFFLNEAFCINYKLQMFMCYLLPHLKYFICLFYFKNRFNLSSAKFQLIVYKILTFKMKGKKKA